MVKRVKIIVLLLVSMFCLEITYSQDLVYLRKDTISVKITDNQSKFITYLQGDTITIKLKKSNILKIELYDGSIEDIGSKNPRKIHPTNFGILLLGSLSNGIDFSEFETDNFSLIELEINHFFRPYLTQSISFSLYKQKPIITFGMRSYLNKMNSNTKLVPFIGAQIGGINLSDSKDAILILQFPCGLDYISKKGYNLALEFLPRTLLPAGWSNAPREANINRLTSPKSSLLMCLKMGKYF
jgi:hypothetical protein